MYTYTYIYIFIYIQIDERCVYVLVRIVIINKIRAFDGSMILSHNCSNAGTLAILDISRRILRMLAVYLRDLYSFICRYSILEFSSLLW